MAMKRSAEELAMRDAIEAWGRVRWPGARIVHELVVGQCRIDMAFVCRDHLIGVEIKGPKDTLDRLKRQFAQFDVALPEVWLAYDNSFRSGIEGRLPVGCGHIRFRDGAINGCFGASVRRTITTPMLHLLWRAELIRIAARHGFVTLNGRATVTWLVELLARRLTGDEIVAETCRELRERDQGSLGKAFWRADPAIVEPASRMESS